jgi:hypothetical protein
LSNGHSGKEREREDEVADHCVKRFHCDASALAMFAHPKTFGPSPSGSRRLSIARSMAECAVAIAADCSAMSLFAMAICARRTASCVRLRRPCIVIPLRLPLNRTHLCFKIAL